MSRVLLVEPDRELAAVYAAALSNAGHVVVTAVTAQAAIEAADNERPDVVVLELQLVAHSGIEFLYEFRTYPDWLNVPLLIHTHVPPGEFGNSRDILMSELGVRAYLYKPQTNLEKLLRTINELVPAR